MTNSLWAILHILQKTVSSRLLYDQQSVSDIVHSVNGSLITSYNQQSVSNKLHILWKTVSSHLFLWPIASEWHWIFLWKAVSSHLFLWPIVCEWHCILCERQFHHILSYDQQQVSNIVHFMRDSLITSFPMTNSLWVTLHILWMAVSSRLITNSGWAISCTFYERQSHHIFFYDQ